MKGDCEMPSSPDTLQMLLTRFALMAWRIIALESTDLSLTLLDCQGSCKPAKFLEPSNVPSLFIQQMFLLYSSPIWSRKA